MATSTLVNIKVVVTTAGTYNVIHRVTANGLTTEKVTPIVIKPEPVEPPASALDIFGYAATGGTTGGAGGTVVTARTYAQLKAAMTSDAPMIVILEGAIKGSSATDQGYYCKGNKTLIGRPGASINFGLWWYGTTGRDNVIIRNIIGKGMPVNGTILKDYFTFKEGPQKIWVDHVDLEQTKGVDGLIDFGDGVEKFTLSHAKLTGAPRACSFGTEHTTGTGAYLYFVDCTERQPAVSQGKAHIFNCLHQSITSNATAGYGISVRDGAEVHVENGVFYNFKGHPYREQRDLVSGSTTVYKPLGKFKGIETTLRITSTNPDQLRGQPVSTYVHTDDVADLILPASETANYVRKSAGATMTAEQVNAYIASIT